MIAPPWRTCFSARASDGFRSSRFGPTCPVVPASFSVWQLPQFDVKIALPSGDALVVVPPPPEVEVVGAAGSREERDGREEERYESERGAQRLAGGRGIRKGRRRGWPRPRRGSDGSRRHGRGR